MINFFVSWSWKTTDFKKGCGSNFSFSFNLRDLSRKGIHLRYFCLLHSKFISEHDRRFSTWKNLTCALSTPFITRQKWVLVACVGICSSWTPLYPAKSRDWASFYATLLCCKYCKCFVQLIILLNTLQNRARHHIAHYKKRSQLDELLFNPG